MKILGVFMLLFSSLASGAKPEVILDDFENDQPWELKEWGDQAQLSLGEAHASHGKKALLVRFDKVGGQPHAKGIVMRRSLLGKAVDYQDFTLDVFVEAQAPVRIGVGIEGDRTYERDPIRLEPGWNRNVRLELLSGRFKAWDADLGSVDLQPDLAIGSLILSLHREVNEPGTVAFDHVRAHHRPEWNFKKPEAAKLDAQSITIKSVRASEEKVETYRPLELTVDLEALVLDPYDPAELELNAVFHGPGGKDWTIPGFLHSGDVNGYEPVRNAVWKIRFTPPRAGEWTYVVTAKNRAQRVSSETFRIKVETGTRDGFVRVDPKSPQYFAFDSGRFYYPMGQNVAWLPFRDYDRYFAKMAEHGENWARIWMTSWSYGIEWKPMGQFLGLGSYNLERAEKLDELLRLADFYGIQLQLVFDFHGAYSSRVNPEWSNNPYNVINGGFLKTPDQFFTHPLAKEIYRKRLRYILARWGYSPQVMAWELFNEVSFTDNFQERSITAWHQEMAEFLKQNDPYKHLVTTSYGGDAIGEVYQLPAIDFSQYHIYAPSILKQFPRIANKLIQYKKPHFIGEFGSDSANGRDDQDKNGVFLHAGLWTQFMQPASGNAMPWWWDSHIEPNQLYYHFQALSRFAQGVDRRSHTWTPLAQKLRMQVGEQAYDFELMGLESSEFSMYWLCDALGMNAKDRTQPIAYEDVKIALTGYKKEQYDVEFWDTVQGKVIQSTKVQSDGERLALTLPRFSNDLAFKIRPRKTIAGLGKKGMEAP